MTSISRRNLLLVTAGLAGVLQLGAAQAEDLNITIGYQTVVEPSKVAQADGAYEAATKAAIDWRKFDSGADVIAAIASGALDIGYVGSSPLAAAASRELPIQTIFVVGLIGASEALVARNGAGVEKIADLAGKKVAVPFVSTTHYSLLAALKHEGVDPKSVEILNLRPPEIAAAWQRGDIDAAYVWDPALGQIKTSGKVVLDSAEVAAWGAPTFDAWIVRTDFAEKHPEAVRAFVKVTGDAYAAYLQALELVGFARAGREDRQAHRRQAGGSAGVAQGLCLPDARGAGFARLSRRRDRRGRKGHVGLPEGAGKDRRGARRLRALHFVQVRHRGAGLQLRRIG